VIEASPATGRSWRGVWLAAIALMAVLAAGWLSYQTYRYFADPGVVGTRQISEGAIDVHNRFREVRSWFAGEPVYRLYKDAVYPPASYAILGAAFNAMPWALAKVVWFAASFAAACGLSRQLVGFSLARSRTERIFLGLMPFAFYATGAALGNGQLVLFVLPLTLNALLLLERPGLSRRNLWLGSLFMLAALVQPTIAAPFFWLVLFRAGGVRAAAIVVGGYLALTAFAVPFQMEAYGNPEVGPRPGGVVDIWTRRAQGGTYYGSIKGGYGTVHDVLASFELRSWNAAASVTILAIAGAWLFRQRRAELWPLLGVTAIVARIWTYHRWYDDLLLLLPLIALFRLTRQPEIGPWTRAAAGALFLWIWAFLLAPGVLYTLPSLDFLVDVQVAGWLVALAFLVGTVEVRGRAAR